MINEYDKNAVVEISIEVQHVYHVYFLKGPQKQDFLDIYLTTFSESVLRKYKISCSHLFFKIFKVYYRFGKCATNWEKGLGFWQNCIWIGIVKLSLVRTGYFSLEANMLTSSHKIWHAKKKTFINSIDLAVINEYDKDALMHRWPGFRSP